MKKKKTSTIDVRQTGHYHYEVNDPKRGATKTPATLDRVLTLTMNDILKYLNTRNLVLSRLASGKALRQVLQG